MFSLSYYICFCIVIFIIITLTVSFIITIIITISTTIIYTIFINNKIFSYLLVDIKANIRLYLLYLVVRKVENNYFQYLYINAVYAKT